MAPDVELDVELDVDPVVVPVVSDANNQKSHYLHDGFSCGDKEILHFFISGSCILNTKYFDKMKKMNILILAFCCFLTAFPQGYHIQGTILDKEMNPIEFATVALLSLPDSSLVGGAMSDSSGKFSLFVSETGNNLLKISFVGYQTEYLPVKSEQTVVLQANSTLLDEVSVKAVRPKVTFKDDRFDVKIENSMAAKGNTIESLLQQLPGVWATSDGSISINGLSGVQIYIDDRPVKLSGAPLMKYLGSFRSEDVKRIEVIQRPSVVYESEGNGIIRIITKKKSEEGVSGIIEAKIDKQYFSGFTPFISLKYYKGDFGANISLNGGKSKWLLLTDNYAKDVQGGVNYETQLADTIFDESYSANVDLYYNVNKYNHLGFNVNYLHWGKDEYITGNTNITGNNTTSIWKTGINQNDLQNMNNYSFTLNYNLLLDTLGNKKITLLSDFVNQYSYNSKSYYNYLNYDSDGNHILTEDILNDQESPFRMFSTEIKYNQVINPENSLISGIKYSNSTISNSLANYDKRQEEWAMNDSIGYFHEYNEKLVSTFIQYNLNRSRWSFIGGLRAEYSLGNIINVEPAEEKLNIFPSLYFNYTLNDENKFGVSYTQRIRRINYLQLLPKRYYTSKYNILEGNPLLKPNVMNNIGVNYNYGGKYHLTLSYRWSDNDLSTFNKNEIINGKSIIVSSYVDGVKTNNVNLNTYIPVDFTSWWSAINQINMDYDNYSTDLVPKFSTFSYDLFTQHTFFLPLNIRGEILYRYLSRAKSAYSESFPYHLLNISLYKSFYNERLNVKIESYRMFYKQKMGSENSTPTVLVRQESYYSKMPFLAFTLSYSFSKGKTKKFQGIQYSNKEEKSRTY